MSKRKHSRSSSRSFSVKRKRTGFSTFFETVMGVSAALIILAGCYWWFFVRVPPREVKVSEVANSAIEDNVVVEPNFEAIRDGGNLAAMFGLLQELEKWPRDAATPVRLETLSRRLEMAEKVMKHPELSEEQRVSTAKAILNAMGQYYGICSQEEILDDGTTVSRYLGICSTFLSDKDESVAKEAHVSKAKVLVFELTRGGQGESADSVKQTLYDLIDRYANDPAVVNDIRVLVGQVNLTDARAGSKLIRDVIAKFEQVSPTEPIVVQQVRDLKDEVLLADSGFGILAQEALNTGSFDRYLAKLFALIEIPDAGIMLVNRIYQAIAAFETAGRHDLARQVLLRLESSVANRTDALAKEKAEQVARFGLIRNEVVGQKFDFSDTDSNGNPLDVSRFENRACIIFYYSPNSRDVGNVINSLNFIYQMISRTNVQVIALAVEKANGEKFESGFAPEWVSIDSNPPDPVEISEIFKRCPVSHVPYFVLIDQNGVVDSINVPQSKLKTRVESLASAARAE